MTETAVKMTKGQKTAHKILEAAARCISKVGVEKTSVTAIAAEADLKRSLIAYHFPRKEKIFYQVIENIIQGLVEIVNKNVEGHEGRKALSETLMTYLNFFNEYPHYFHCLLHFYYLSSIKEKAKAMNTEITQLSLTRFQSYLKQVLDAEGLQSSSQNLNSFARIIYTRMIGSIMQLHCVELNTAPQTFINRNLTILNQEIDLFVHYIRSQNK